MIEALQNLFTLPFMQRALVVGVCVSITAALLGIFVTLRHLSFYADTISHSALAGIALGLLLGFTPLTSAIVFCALFGAGTVYIKRNSHISMDTVVGVLFASSLALGVLLISLIPSYRSELFTILFGDILTASWPEVWLTVISCVVVIGFLIITRKRLILSTFVPEFLFIRGISTAWLEYAFFIMTALTIAVSIRVIGVILMTGLLILPAAVARNMAHSFKQFMWLAMAVSLVCTLLGILLSYQFNLPTGPTIILVGTVLFGLTLAVREK